MREPNAFILESLAINTDASNSISKCSVSTLHQKVGYNPMELISFVMVLDSFFSRAESSEILSSLGDLLSEQFKNDSSSHVILCVFLSNFYIEVGLSILRIKLWKSRFDHFRWLLLFKKSILQILKIALFDYSVVFSQSFLVWI